MKTTMLLAVVVLLLLFVTVTVAVRSRGAGPLSLAGPSNCTANQVRLFTTLPHYRRPWNCHYYGNVAEKYSERYNPTMCLMLGNTHANSRPPMFHQFDWVLSHTNRKNLAEVPRGRRKCNVTATYYSKMNVSVLPERILCAPNFLMGMVAHLLTVPGARVNHGSNITLVVAGEDSHLSVQKAEIDEFLRRSAVRPEDPKKIEELFGRIFYEAKDIVHPTIKTWPEGINFNYIMRSGVDRVVTALDRSSANKVVVKKVLVGAAWGVVWSMDEMWERKTLSEFIAKSSFVARQQWRPEEYWDRLSECRYLLCPPGGGVQSPKFAESWLVRTIPVAIRNPAFLDLAAMGFPFYFVDSWQEITEAKLESALKTRFKNVDWDNVRHMISTDFHVSLLYGNSTPPLASYVH